MHPSEADFKDTDTSRDHPTIVGDPVETFNEGPTKEPREKKVPVVEIFGPTIQGEGAMIGVRTSFIRFGLCDYKCTMCDSMHAVDPLQVKKNATWMTPIEMMNGLYDIHFKDDVQTCDWVTFSGGNPCIHDLSQLVLGLTNNQIQIAVETQGTFLPEWLKHCDVITVSPKSPGMGEQFEEDKFVKFLEAFYAHPGFNVKVVVFSMLDIEWARYINRLMIGHGCYDKMYLSLGNPFPPGQTKIEGEDGHISDEDLKIRLLNDYSSLTEDLLQIPDMKNVRFLPQLHVLCWANKQKV